MGQQIRVVAAFPVAAAAVTPVDREIVVFVRVDRNGDLIVTRWAGIISLPAGDESILAVFRALVTDKAPAVFRDQKLPGRLTRAVFQVLYKIGRASSRE